MGNNASTELSIPPDSPVGLMRETHGSAAVQYQNEWVKWTRGYWPAVGNFKAQDLQYVKSMSESYLKQMSPKKRDKHLLALSVWELEIKIRNEKRKVKTLEQNVRKEKAEKRKLQTLVSMSYLNATGKTEVQAKKITRHKSRICYLCKKPGHFIKNCPNGQTE